MVWEYFTKWVKLIGNARIAVLFWAFLHLKSSLASFWGSRCHYFVFFVQVSATNWIFRSSFLLAYHADWGSFESLRLVRIDIFFVFLLWDRGIHTRPYTKLSKRFRLDSNRNLIAHWPILVRTLFFIIWTFHCWIFWWNHSRLCC